MKVNKLKIKKLVKNKKFEELVDMIKNEVKIPSEKRDSCCVFIDGESKQIAYIQVPHFYSHKFHFGVEIFFNRIYTPCIFVFKDYTGKKDKEYYFNITFKQAGTVKKIIVDDIFEEK